MEANMPAAGIGEAVIADQIMVEGNARLERFSDEEAANETIDFDLLLQQDALTKPAAEETGSDAEKEKTGAEALAGTPAHITLPELEIPLSKEEQLLVGEGRPAVEKTLKITDGKVVLKNPEEAQVLTNDMNMASRRKNTGQVLYDGQFPVGWEVLLEDKTAQKPVSPIKTTAAIRQQFEFSGKVIQPGSENKLPAREGAPPKEGLMQLDFNTPGNPETETIPLPAKKTEFASYSRELSQSALTADSGGENLKTPSVNAVKSSAPSVGQIILKMTEAQKQMSVKTIVQTTVKGIHAKQEQLIVELQPPELGRIKIIVQNNGEQVNAHLTIQDPRVGEFLQERMEAIRKSLEEAGIRLGDLKLEIKQEFNLQSEEEAGDMPGAKQQKPMPLDQENKTGATTTRPVMRWNHEGKVNMVI